MKYSPANDCVIAALWIANQNVVPVLVTSLQNHVDSRILRHERKAVANFQGDVRRMYNSLHRTVWKARETSQRFAELRSVTDSMVSDLQEQEKQEHDEKEIIIQDRGYLSILRNQLGGSMTDTDSRDANIALLKDQSLHFEGLQDFYDTEVDMLGTIISQHDAMTVFLDKEMDDIRAAEKGQLDLTEQRADIIRSLQIINTRVEEKAPGLREILKMREQKLKRYYGSADSWFPEVLRLLDNV